MFERKRENVEAIGRAFAAVEGLPRGEAIAHEALEGLLGVRRYPGSRYYRLVDRLKNKMEKEVGHSLAPVLDEGYRVVTVDGQIALGQRRSVQATRMLRRGFRHVAAIPEAECDFTQLRAKQAIEEKLSMAERTMRSEAQRIAFLMRPRESRPVPVAG